MIIQLYHGTNVTAARQILKGGFTKNKTYWKNYPPMKGMVYLPDAEIRNKLKAAGFRWVKAREMWAHNCGHPCRRGNGDPRYKYGSVRVEDF